MALPTQQQLEDSGDAGVGPDDVAPGQVGRLIPGVLDLGTVHPGVAPQIGAPPAAAVPTAPPGTAAPADTVSTAPAGEADDTVLTADGASGAVAPTTTGDKIAAVGTSALKSGIDNGSAMAGLGMGAALGAAVPGLEPVTVPVGAAVGLVAGYLASHSVTDALSLPDPEQMAPDLRPYAYLGQSIGGTAGAAGATVGIAKAGVTSTVPFIDTVLAYAKAHPFAFAAGETTPGIYAGYAGEEAENVAPGNTKDRFLAELAGGFLSPWNLASGAFRAVVPKVKYAMNGMTAEGRATNAAKRLSQVLADNGEDMGTLQVTMARPDLTGFDETGQQVTAALPSAAKSGSPALQALQNELAKQDPKFGQLITQKVGHALDAMRGMIGLLKGTGDPAALSAAAEARSAYYRTLVHGAVQAAMAKAVASAEKISTLNQAARAALSKTASDALQNALRLARAYEKELWSKVPTNVLSNAEGVIAAYKEISKDVPKEFGMPSAVQAFVRRMEKGPLDEANDAAENAKLADAGFSVPTDAGVPGPGAEPPTTSGELKNFRAEMLDAARAARAASQFNMARKFDTMADGALDDLNVAGEKAGGDAYNAAREFSRVLNDVFTRTFAKDAGQVIRSGAERISPEEMLDDAIGSGDIQGDIRLRQLQDATEFMSTQGLDSPEAAANVEAMRNAQSQITRLAAKDTTRINPMTGEREVSPTRLAAFMERYQSILDRFPDVKTDIENAMNDAVDAKNTLDGYAGNDALAKGQAIVAKLLSSENATTAVGKLVSGPKPETDVQDAIDLAKKSGPQAVAGLRSALIENAMNVASDAKGVTSFAKLDEALNSPMAKGSSGASATLPPSVVDMMRRNGMMNQSEVGRLNQILAAGQKAEGIVPGHVPPAAPQDILATMLPRIIGARVGQKGAEAVLGQTSLVAQSAFARATEQYVRRLGVGQTRALIEGAITDPALFQALKTPVTTQAQGVKVLLKVHASLLRMGLDFSAQQDPAEVVPDGENPDAVLQAPGPNPDAVLTAPGSTAVATPAPKPDAIHAAIAGQEKSNRTSVDGAVGPMQVRPATFARFAEPGEDIHNEKDNVAVGNRYIDYLLARFGNDPARAAVGYFSGESNVAPAGAEHPFLHNRKDGNGKTVASYVADVLKRVQDQ